VPTIRSIADVRAANERFSGVNSGSSSDDEGLGSLPALLPWSPTTSPRFHHHQHDLNDFYYQISTHAAVSDPESEVVD